MKDYSFSMSANNLMTYFVKQNCMYFIVNKSDIKESVAKSYDFVMAHRRSIEKQTDIALKAIYFGIIRQGKDKNLSEFFIDTYLQSNEYKKNAFVAIKNFGEVNLRYECELLIDFLFCVCENSRRIDATINYKADSDTATLQMMKKNPNSYGMLYDLKLPLEQLDSYVVNNMGILMRLKDGSILKYGANIEEVDYEKYLSLYEFDTNKFLYRV